MDFTVLEFNSDYEIRDLLTKDDCEIVAGDRDYKDWADEVNAYFSKMNQKGISIEKIKNRIQSIPLTNGFKELFDTLRSIKFHNKFLDEYKNSNIDMIFLSGANVHYVSWVLEKYGLNDIISDTISFSSSVINETLVVGEYHKHNCPNCDKNLCKQKAITDYVANINTKRSQIGLPFIYDGICYIGDGGNDYCAGIALSNLNVKLKNHLLVRKGFMLHRMLYDHEGNPRPKNKALKCDVSLWHDGNELSKIITKNFLI